MSEKKEESCHTLCVWWWGGGYNECVIDSSIINVIVYVGARKASKWAFRVCESDL